MTVQDLENLKPGDIPQIDLEAMPVFADVTFRIPVNLGEDHDHRGMYKAMATPVDLPNGHKGYYLSVIRRDGDNGEYLSIIWTETLKLKEGGFVLSNHEVDVPAEIEHNTIIRSNYLRISPSPFVFRLNVGVDNQEPEKLHIKLLGPFSEVRA
jgi:hypothetical protein|nr:MAG TPA: hypothetical protein [Caudoviricetes sp.]